jgi:hypothetical protein
MTSKRSSVNRLSVPRSSSWTSQMTVIYGIQLSDGSPTSFSARFDLTAPVGAFDRRSPHTPPALIEPMPQ